MSTTDPQVFESLEAYRREVFAREDELLRGLMPAAVQGAEFYGLVVTAKITSDISPNSASMDGTLTPLLGS